MPVTVALVDDHPILLSGIAQVFESDGEFQVVAHGATAEDAVNIVDTHVPQILMLDLSLPGDAWAAIGKIASQGRATKIVAFTACAGIETAIRTLEAGASGYILKGSSVDDVLRGVRAVMNGEIYITQGFATKVISALTNASVRKMAARAIRLSIREDQVIRLLLRGRTNREIALTLGISEKTVKKYMSILMQKLQARNRLEVVIAAQKLASSMGQDALGERATN